MKKSADNISEVLSDLDVENLPASLKSVLSPAVSKMSDVDADIAEGAAESDEDIYWERYYEVENELGELYDRLNGDIAALLDTPQSEVADLEVIACVRKYAFEREKLIAGEQLEICFDMRDSTVRHELLERLSNFLTDDHRHAIVSYHAQGLSTADAVCELACRFEVINELSTAIGSEALRKKLVHNFAYLKPGTTGWSEKKYGETYRGARAAYKEVLRDIPMSSAPEQVALLVKHIDRIDAVLEGGDMTLKA